MTQRIGESDRTIGLKLSRACLIPVITLVQISSVGAEDPKQTLEKDGVAQGNIDTNRETGEISGRVFDKDGQPAANAKVILLFPPPKGQKYYTGSLPLREVDSDAEGKFSFTSLTPGKFNVWANRGKFTSRSKARRLAAGHYDISLMSAYERIEGTNDGSMTNRRLASVSIDVEEGEVAVVDFTSETAVQN